MNSFSVDLGTIFTNLDANIAQNADATKTTVTTADGNFFALTSTTSIGDGLYKVAENTAIAFKKADGGAATIAARNATKAVITLGYASSKYTTAAKDIANIYGTFNLTLTLKDKQGNELKKVIVPVTVSKPEFDDYYTANQYAGWNEGVLSSVIDNSGNTPAFTMPINLYTINKKADGTTGMTDAQPDYVYTYKKAAVDNSEVKEAASITFNDVVKDGFLKTTDYKVKASNEVVTVNALTGVSNAAADNTISVSKEFTMKLAPAFNKAKLVYYTNGVAGTVAAVNADGIIAPLTGDGTANKPKNGLALQYGDEEIAVSTTAIPASESDDHKLGGYKVTTGSAATGAVVVEFAKSAESAGGSVTLETGDAGVKIADLNAGQGGELVVTFTDYAGIKTQATIEYKK